MPELPEVENVVRTLQDKILHKKVVNFNLSGYKLRRGPNLGSIQDNIILNILRRGKYIIMELQNGMFQLVHLGMSGNIIYHTKPAILKKHDHVRIIFDDGSEMVFHDPRRFGIWDTVHDFKNDPAILKLGMEPFDDSFNNKNLYNLLRNKKVNIKQALMDNKIVVGIGNIYISEILMAAGIRPTRPAQALSLQALERITKHTKIILSDAIKMGGSTIKDYKKADGKSGSFQDYFKVYGRNGMPCVYCGNRIEKIILGCRATYFCPSCQA